jgi:hypothetical protein
MKNKDFARLGKQLLPDLPGFAVKGPYTFIAPVGHSLRGLCFESHSYEANLFYVWVFFLPVFIPRKYVSLNFGRRLQGPNGDDRWNADAPTLIADLRAAVERQALPFLSAIRSP